MHLGGVLFVDSADKAARFIWLCDAFNVPLLFLADVPGFMIGSQVERQGIIRHGAKMITAVAEATVPKISVIVRKAYGAGLYAMCGPAFDPDACLALPTAQIAVMGPEPAVNAVFYNRIQAIEDPDERAAFVAERAARVRGGRRPRAPRGRARRRRGRAARGPARRARRGGSRWPPAGCATTPTSATASRRSRPVGSPRHTGCGAAWLARLTGGQEVAGSNPASPTTKAEPASQTAESVDFVTPLRFLSRPPAALTTSLLGSAVRRRSVASGSPISTMYVESIWPVSGPMSSALCGTRGGMRKPVPACSVSVGSSLDVHLDRARRR